MNPRIAVISTPSILLDNAYEAIVALDFPQIEQEQADFDLFIHVNNDGIFLTSNNPDLRGKFSIDFVGGKTGYRWRSQEGKRQPLARAVGLHQKAGLNILDVTAGMGRDALILAQLGAQVTMCERSPVLAALLSVAMYKARQEQELAPVINRMQLLGEDAIELLNSMTEEQVPDVIYMDPMYPHRSKSALVKKEMRFIRALVGDDQDADELLTTALKKASRVVVKRPKGAPQVAGLKPSHTIESKNTRYDVYCR